MAIIPELEAAPRDHWMRGLSSCIHPSCLSAYTAAASPSSAHVMHCRVLHEYIETALGIWVESIFEFWHFSRDGGLKATHTGHRRWVGFSHVYQSMRPLKLPTTTTVCIFPASSRFMRRTRRMLRWRKPGDIRRGYSLAHQPHVPDPVRSSVSGVPSTTNLCLCRCIGTT